MKKRLLSLILAIIMIILALPISAVKANSEEQLEAEKLESKSAIHSTIVDTDLQHTEARKDLVMKTNQSKENLIAWKNDQAHSKIAVVAGVHQGKSLYVLQVLLCQLQRMLPGNAAPVAPQKNPVSLFQGYPGAAVLPVILTAPSMLHPQLIQGPDHMLRHRIVAEYPHIGRFRPQHLCIDRKIQSLSSGKHHAQMLILVTHIISDAYYLHLPLL